MPGTPGLFLDLGEFSPTLYEEQTLKREFIAFLLAHGFGKPERMWEITIRDPAFHRTPHHLAQHSHGFAWHTDGGIVAYYNYHDEPVSYLMTIWTNESPTQVRRLTEPASVDRTLVAPEGSTPVHTKRLHAYVWDNRWYVHTAPKTLGLNRWLIRVHGIIPV